MQVIKVTRRLEFEGTFNLDPGSYVFSDALAEEIKTIGNSEQKGSVVDDPIRFEFRYREYDGRPLNGKKLFLWRTGGAGDLTFMTPVLRHLKIKYPDCQIVLSCDGRYVDLMVDHPYLDAVVPYPVKLEYLDEADYHLCFEALIEHNPDAKKKNAIDLFLEKFGLRLPPEEKLTVLGVVPKAIEDVNELLNKHDIERDNFIVGIQFRVDAPIRQYPTPFLIEIARMLADHHRAKIIWFGSPGHAAEISAYGQGKYRLHENSVNLPRYLVSWQHSVAATSFCDVVIGADSATIHLAGAYKRWRGNPKVDFNLRHTTPVVGLYGPFLAGQRIKYYRNAVGMTAEVACTGCNQHGYEPCRLGWPSPCFGMVQPEAVVGATMRLIAQQKDIQKKMEGRAHFAIPIEEWAALNQGARRNPFGNVITASPVDALSL